MSDPIDNSWLSETAKTWIVSITMAILVGGALYGFYAAQIWKTERAEQKQSAIELQEMNDRLQELKNDDN